MEDITPIILLSTVFCGLVVVLYLYGRFMQFLHQRSPPVNKLKLENWLLDNNVILPTKEKIIIEFNVLADGISSIDGGVKWQNLKIEKFLPTTSIPEFEILSIKTINTNQVSFKCCVSWPDCVPGIEVSMIMAGEKITCHLQVDWMLMFANCTITKLSDGGVSISWVQTKPPVSALSCMVIDPPHWKADIDITQPLLENPSIEASEGVASSVAEGVLNLIKSFQLKEVSLLNDTNYNIDTNHTNNSTNDSVNGDIQNGEEMKKIEEHSESNNNNGDRNVDESVEEWVVVDKEVITALIEETRENTNSVQEITNSVQEITNSVQENTNSVQEITNDVQESITNVVQVKTINEQEITENVKEITEDVQEITEDVITEDVKEITEDVHVIPENLPENTEDVKEITKNVQEITENLQEPEDIQESKPQEEAETINGDHIQETTNDVVDPNGVVISVTPTIENSNRHSPSLKWHNNLPIITEPLKDPNETTRDTSLLSTRYERISIDESPAPSPRTLPRYLKELRYSEEDLSSPDKSSFDRSRTFSIRSYDTDSPMTDASGRFLSTVVFEVQDGEHKKHIVALNPAHANRLRKQLQRYTKLHIYNDHTFIAQHIKSKQICCICDEKISGLFGKQAYICRDCDIHTHKNCHHKTESNCTRSQVSTLNLVYPDNISSAYSLQ